MQAEAEERKFLTAGGGCAINGGSSPATPGKHSTLSRRLSRSPLTRRSCWLFSESSFSAIDRRFMSFEMSSWSSSFLLLLTLLLMRDRGWGTLGASKDGAQLGRKPSSETRVVIRARETGTRLVHRSREEVGLRSKESWRMLVRSNH